MQLGMIGLGRMGANMVRRLIRDGHDCVVNDRDPAAVQTLIDEGATGSTDVVEFVAGLAAPRSIWLMVPAGVVDAVLEGLVDHVDEGDTVIDGGNSYYKDDLVRGRELAAKGLHYVDCGVSGGVWGLENGYGLMVGGDDEAVARLEPVLASLAPGVDAAPRTEGRIGEPTPAEHGWLHCGPTGSGHFVKMVHNGIEYGIMAAYAEGLNILRHADIGNEEQTHDAETTPLRDPDEFKFDIDVGEVTEVWRRGTVIRSWLLDLTAKALLADPELESFSGRVSDSGEGRWTMLAAIEEGVPAHVLSAALFDRFESQGRSEFAAKVQSAQRYEFGGHHEKPDADAK
jgi:6-phosphogluconate dehydrogenase